MVRQIMKCLFKTAVLFALAQPAMSADIDPMARLDTNQNRLLEESEAQAAGRQSFGSIDENRHGRLRPEEIRVDRVGQSRRLRTPMRMGDSVSRNTPLY
jgi:hypothetical protein